MVRITQISTALIDYYRREEGNGSGHVRYWKEIYTNHDKMVTGPLTEEEFEEQNELFKEN